MSKIIKEYKSILMFKNGILTVILILNDSY